MRNTILILDGNQRCALAATRSLGTKGLRVIVGEEFQPSLAAASRFSADKFTYPTPYNSPDAFIETLADECKRRSVDVLYPMTDISMYHVLKNRDRFEGVIIPCASFDAYEKLTDKWKLFETARELALSIPSTLFIRDAADLRNSAPDLRFPVAVKPYRSRILSNGRWLRASVQYADSWAELESTVGAHEYLAHHPFLLQQYIHGENQGIFTLYDRGKPLVFFMHHRLRERPPSGGVSVLSESIPMNGRARAIAERVFNHVGWHGVGMAEFKVTRDGAPYLLEVNARFWGTLQLAIDSGIDFPWLLYQLGTGTTPDRVEGYAAGVRNRWLIGDIIHALMTLTGRGMDRYKSRAERWRALSDFFRFFDRRTRYEINRWNDLKPFAVELKQSFAKRTPAQSAPVSTAKSDETCESA